MGFHISSLSFVKISRQRKAQIDDSFECWRSAHSNRTTYSGSKACCGYRQDDSRLQEKSQRLIRKDKMSIKKDREYFWRSERS